MLRGCGEITHSKEKKEMLELTSKLREKVCSEIERAAEIATEERKCPISHVQALRLIATYCDAMLDRLEQKLREG